MYEPNVIRVTSQAQFGKRSVTFKSRLDLTNPPVERWRQWKAIRPEDAAPIALHTEFGKGVEIYPRFYTYESEGHWSPTIFYEYNKKIPKIKLEQYGIYFDQETQRLIFLMEVSTDEANLVKIRKLGRSFTLQSKGHLNAAFEVAGLGSGRTENAMRYAEHIGEDQHVCDVMETGRIRNCIAIR